MSLNPDHGEVYLTQHYVIMFVSDLRQVGGFLCILILLHQYIWPPRYNWYTVESVVKHPNPVSVNGSIASTFVNVFILQTLSRVFLFLNLEQDLYLGEWSNWNLMLYCIKFYFLQKHLLFSVTLYWQWNILSF
jgi:hypothetical protein